MSAERPPAPEPSLEELSRAPRPSLAAEFWDYLRDNRKWWLTPILLVLAALAGLFALVSTSGFAPFLYPLL